MLAPILVHTAEECWAAMPHKSQKTDSVHLALMPKADNSIDWQGNLPRWEKLMALRDEVLLALELLRQNKVIGSNQESSVMIHCSGEDAESIEGFGLQNFAALCIVSEVKLEKTEGQAKVAAHKSSHTKCQRCWNYWPSVGSNSNYPDVCERCAKALKQMDS